MDKWHGPEEKLKIIKQSKLRESLSTKLARGSRDSPDHLLQVGRFTTAKMPAKSNRKPPYALRLAILRPLLLVIRGVLFLQPLPRFWVKSIAFFKQLPPSFNHLIGVTRLF